MTTDAKIADILDTIAAAIETGETEDLRSLSWGYLQDALADEREARDAVRLRHTAVMKGDSITMKVEKIQDDN